MRIQSPSSMNTYYQCPRKYFYQYIMKLPTKPSIHLARGKAVHEALENFFKLDATRIENPDFEHIKLFLLDLFRQAWIKYEDEFKKLDMSRDDLMFYYTESKKMLENWFTVFAEKINRDLQGKTFAEAFNYHTPETEAYYHSQKHNVRGYIDAIHEYADGVYILDYKTSKRPEISKAYRLQLGIYALLYKTKHGTLPKGVGIHFLKHGEQIIPVDDVLLRDAEAACEEIAELTKSTEMIDYPKKESPLCKWSSGQCDFYETCFKVKKKSLE